VRRILPDLLAAAGRVRASVPTVQFIVARAPGLADHLFHGVAGVAASVEGETDAVLSSADVALTASGTATVQCALHDTPMVIVYRVSPLEYLVGRRLVTLDTFGMVNLIAGEKIVPELIQHVHSGRGRAEAISMLTDPARHAESVRDWRACASGWAVPAPSAPPRRFSA
jgi:lipid-A-disaccharide synthase